MLGHYAALAVLFQSICLFVYSNLPSTVMPPAPLPRLLCGPRPPAMTVLTRATPVLTYGQKLTDLVQNFL